MDAPTTAPRHFCYTTPCTKRLLLSADGETLAAFKERIVFDHLIPDLKTLQAYYAGRLERPSAGSLEHVRCTLDSMDWHIRLISGRINSLLNGAEGFIGVWETGHWAEGETP